MLSRIPNTEKTHLRTIRSYVRREGRMTAAQQQAFDNYWPQFGSELNDQLLDATSIFSRAAPVIIDIGFGMGHSLLACAQQQLENNFIGIEVFKTGIGALFQQMQQHAVDNIRLFHADAVEVLKKAFLPNTVAGIQIFFPDPWPKKRHHKRRLIQPEFLELIHHVLEPGGFIHLATDWENYAYHMRTVLQANNNFKNSATHEQGFIERPATRPITKYEQRGQRLGHATWDLFFRKKI